MFHVTTVGSTTVALGSSEGGGKRLGCCYQQRTYDRLIVILVGVLVVDVVVPQLVRRLGRRNHVQPIAQLLLLQVLLREVLEIPLGQRRLRVDKDLGSHLHSFYT